MVGDLRHEIVDMRLEIGAIHPFDVAAWNGMPQVADDGVDDECLTVGIKVGAPRVGHAVHHLLDDPADRVIPPDAGVDLHSLRIARAGRADLRGALNAVPGPEPAVRSPRQAVAGRVPDAPFVDAIEHDLRRTVGDEVVVAVGDEQEVGQVDHPDTSEAHRDARHPRAAIPEHGPFVVPTVSVAVGEDDDPIPERVVPDAEAVARPGEVLGHPEPATGVGADADRVLHVGLGGEWLEREARRQAGRSADLGRIHRPVGGLLRIGRGREIRGGCAAYDEERHHQARGDGDGSPEPVGSTHAASP